MKLKVSRIDYPNNPREEWDNLGKMICWHSRYSLGDKHDYDFRGWNSWKEQEKYFRKNYAVVLPLYLYDHSGITISTAPFHCPWDSGQVGWIVASKEDILKWYHKKKLSKKLLDDAVASLHEEVDTYDLYIRGEVYGFIIEDEEGEVVDSCFGFYGSDHAKSGLIDSVRETEYFRNISNEELNKLVINE